MILVLLLIAFCVWGVYVMWCQLSAPTPPTNAKAKFISDVKNPNASSNNKTPSTSKPFTSSPNKCPECGTCFSNRPEICLHCGYPFEANNNIPPTDFQNNLRLNMKTKEQVAEEKQKQIDFKIIKDVEREIESIKYQLTKSAQSGDYKVDIYGRNTLSIISTSLTKNLTKTSVYNPFNEFSRWQSQASMGMSPSRRRNFYRSNSNAFAKSFNEHGVVAVSVKDDYLETFESYKRLLAEKLSTDGITVTPIVCFRDTEYNIPAIFEDHQLHLSDYEKGSVIAFKYTCVIPK